MPDKNKAFLPAMLSLGVRNVSLVPIFIMSSTFLKNDSRLKDAKEYDIDISKNINFNPIYIACKDNLEEKF
jgi:hypothetical protein